MFAKIMIDNNIYVTPVFAYILSVSKSKAVVLNKDYSELIVVDFYNKKSEYQLLLIDNNYDDFAIIEDNFKCYWDIRNISKIVKKKRYSLEMLNEAKNIAKTYKEYRHKEIKNNQDLEMLDLNTGSFHDAYILDMKQNKDELEILFDSPWGSALILKCSGVTENKLNIGDSFFYCNTKIMIDKSVEFSFDLDNDKEEVLKAKSVSLNFLFSKRIMIKKFDYSINNNTINLKLNNTNYLISYNNIYNDVLNLKETNSIGYFDTKGNVIFCFILFENYILSFLILKISKKVRIFEKINEFKKDCELNGFFYKTID